MAVYPPTALEYPQIAKTNQKITKADCVERRGGRGLLPADENLDVSFGGHGLFEEVFGDVSCVTLPFFGWFVEEVEYSELKRVIVFQLCEFVFHEDIIFRNLPQSATQRKEQGREYIAINQGDFGLVIGVVEDMFDELVTGGDSRPAGNKANFLVPRVSFFLLGGGTCFPPICIWELVRAF